MKVAFVHPDLGIGGAERLVVDAALSLVGKGHDVTIYTGHHDPSRCFPATMDGRLKVVVRGSWVPRQICGLGHIVCASLTNVVTALGVVFANDRFDVVVCDQIATGVPFLRWFGHRVAFYVHFPDKLLASRTSWLRRLYRWPFDKLEEKTTNFAHVLIANSTFTANTFKEAFPSIRRTPTVLYPAVDIPILRNEPRKTKRPYILSLNRYERKKRIDLAVDAMALLDQRQCDLVVAGGYDDRVQENVDHYQELVALAGHRHVIFERSVSDERRMDLIRGAVCLLYTPPLEHFGIVPLEAMALGCPVIAVNSGGPLETVKDGVTGFLVDPTPAAFAAKISAFLDDPDLRSRCSNQAKAHVQQHFSTTAFADRLDTLLKTVLLRES